MRRAGRAPPSPWQPRGCGGPGCLVRRDSVVQRAQQRLHGEGQCFPANGSFLGAKKNPRKQTIIEMFW